MEIGICGKVGESSSPDDVWELSWGALGDQDGLIAVLRVYMDESGIHDGSPVVTVGAYVATPKEWRLWTRDWNAAKAPIKVFHASDCAALVEEFEGWDDVRRDAYVAKLLPVLPRFNLKGLVVGINLDDFNTVMKGHDDLRALLGTPYTACFSWAVSEILRSEPANQRIAFFHETNNFKREALEEFATLQKTMKAEQRTSLTFGSKQAYTPLQAADVLAFEGHKRLRGPLERPMRRAWIALDNADGEARCKIKYFNKENLPWMVDQLKAYSQRVGRERGAQGRAEPCLAFKHIPRAAFPLA